MFELRAGEIFDLEDIFTEFSRRFGDILEKREILPICYHLDLPCFTSGEKRPHSRFFETTVTSRKVKLEESDIKILKSIAFDWPSSNRELAAIVGLPASTIAYRIERMEREQLILGSRLWANFSLLGEYRYLHLLSVTALTPSVRRQFIAFAKRTQCISTFRSLLGHWDFVIDTHHPNPEQVAEFTESLHRDFPDLIAERTTLAVINFVKVSDCTTVDAYQ